MKMHPIRKKGSTDVSHGRLEYKLFTICYFDRGLGDAFDESAEPEANPRRRASKPKKLDAGIV